MNRLTQIENGLVHGQIRPQDAIQPETEKTYQSTCPIFGGQNENVQLHRSLRNSGHFRVYFINFNYVSNLETLRLGVKD